jgi:hypothetical protein
MDSAPDIPTEASAPAEPKGPSLEPSNALPAPPPAPADSVHGKQRVFLLHRHLNLTLYSPFHPPILLFSAPSTDVEKEDTRADPADAEHSGEAAVGGPSPPGEPAVEVPAPVAVEEPPRRARRAAAAAASMTWNTELMEAAQRGAEEDAMADMRLRKKRGAEPAARAQPVAAAPPPPALPPVAPAEQPLPQAHPEQLERYAEGSEMEEEDIKPASEPVPAPATEETWAAQRRSSRARQRSRILGDDMLEEIPEDVLNACFDSDGEPIEAAPARPKPPPPPPPPPKRARPALGLANQTLDGEDAMLGCPKCRWSRGGCGQCRERPAFSRPSARWNPAAGRLQAAVTNAPTFRPTPEEWAEGPISYISKIMPEAMRYGIAHIVPPSGWAPPFALEKGTNGLSMDSFKFNVRKQPTSQLCYRSAPRPGSTGGVSGGAASGRYGRKAGGGVQQQEETAAAAVAAAEEQPAAEQPAPLPPAAPQEPEPQAPASPPPLSIDDIKEALAFANPGTEPLPLRDAAVAVPPPTAAPPPPSPPPTDFGFVSLDRKHTLRSFSAYADWAKAVHFSTPFASGEGTPSAPGRRPGSLPHHAEPPIEPSVEEIEAEFWRIVETPGAPGPVEALYGQDLDSGHHGSGFPLPEWRRDLLERHLNADLPSFGERITLPPLTTPEERAAAEDPWNINNMPRCPSSVLSVLPGDDLITGVMVPWLYVGSCLSAFCWHVEDHALYSVNFLHMGAPKVWYGVPATATRALEEAMSDALPHLFAANPGLLHQLVTTLSPAELARRGVPVHRVVHEAGSFVVTMPDAYHAGFNTGFNCAEAVNFAAPGWLPYGTDITQKYRDAGKPVTMSHDSLLVSLATAALHIPRSLDVAPGAAAAEGDELSPPDSALGCGKISWAQVPLQGVILGAGDLALRADEEAARWAAGLAALGLPSLPLTRMDPWSPSPGLKDDQGVHVDTAEVDCAECSGDLWLAAVVSAGAPGTAVCPQHAAVMVSKHGCSPESLRMLCRHTPEELQALVTVAAARIEGVAAAAAAARARRARNEAERVLSKIHGPLYPTDEEGRWLRPHTPAASGPREEAPAAPAMPAMPAVDDESEDVEVVDMPEKEVVFKAEPEEPMEIEAAAAILAPLAPPAAPQLVPVLKAVAPGPGIDVQGPQDIEKDTVPPGDLAAALAPAEPAAPLLPVPLLVPAPAGEEMEVDIVGSDAVSHLGAAVDAGAAAPTAPPPQI